MDYIQEINAFYDLDMPNQLTPNAISLYFALLNIANKLFWRADFVVSNRALMAKAGIESRATLNRARNMLVQKGLIEYKPSGKTNKAGIYTIKGCLFQIPKKNDTSINNYQNLVYQNFTTDNATDSTTHDTPHDTGGDTINKLNKTKQNKTNIISLSQSQLEPAATKKDRKEFTEDSTEYKVALYLFKKIRSHLPTFKEPNLQSWAKDIDLLLRIDKRPLDEVKEVIDFCQADDFWKTNILSPKKLREKYDQLNAKRLAQKEGSLKHGYTSDKFYEFFRKNGGG